MPTDLGTISMVQKDVGQLEVFVNDCRVLTMEVTHACCDLIGPLDFDRPPFTFSEGTFGVQKVVQRPNRHVFHDQTEFLWATKEAEELYH